MPKDVGNDVHEALNVWARTNRPGTLLNVFSDGLGTTFNGGKADAVSPPALGLFNLAELKPENMPAILLGLYQLHQYTKGNIYTGNADWLIPRNGMIPLRGKLFDYEVRNYGWGVLTYRVGKPIHN